MAVLISMRFFMEHKMTFSENVVLIDAAFINKFVVRAKQELARNMGRDLPEIDLPQWLTYMALDAGLRGGDNEVQVLIVHDEKTDRLGNCFPAELKEIDGKACRTQLGEFAFSCANPAGITHCEDLFIDLMTLALDAAEVKHLMLLPCHSQYGAHVEEELNELLKDKSDETCAKALYFSLTPPSTELRCRWDFITYSLLKAWGISGKDMM